MAAGSCSVLRLQLPSLLMKMCDRCITFFFAKLNLLKNNSHFCPRNYLDLGTTKKYLTCVILVK